MSESENSQLLVWDEISEEIVLFKPDNMRKVLKQLFVIQPDFWNQGLYMEAAVVSKDTGEMVQANDWYEYEAEDETCGTFRCIAGQAAMFNGWTMKKDDRPGYSSDWQFVDPQGRFGISGLELEEDAQEYLGITYDEKRELFHGENSYEDVKRISQEIFSERGLQVQVEGLDW